MNFLHFAHRLIFQMLILFASCVKYIYICIFWEGKQILIIGSMLDYLIYNKYASRSTTTWYSNSSTLVFDLMQTKLCFKLPSSRHLPENSLHIFHTQERTRSNIYNHSHGHLSNKFIQNGFHLFPSTKLTLRHLINF